MKSSIISFLFSSVLFITSFGQVKDASKNIKLQADKLGQAFVSGDYKTFAYYTHPLILKSLGGAAKMIELLNKGTQEMKAKGINIHNVTFDMPSKIVKSGTELQATIAQHIDMKISEDSLIASSTLITISTDNGVNWTFIDTSNKDIATLRKKYPNLSPSITIPAQQPPVRKNS